MEPRLLNLLGKRPMLVICRPGSVVVPGIKPKYQILHVLNKCSKSKPHLWPISVCIWHTVPPPKLN